MDTVQQLPPALQDIDGLAIDPPSVLSLPEANNSWWVKLVSAAGSVEGKLHLPPQRAARLLVFEPGFPGGGSTDFDKLHAPGFLKVGYAVFTARHNGTLLNGKHSSYYVNCPQRQDRALAENQLCLGEKTSYALSEWLNEPLVAFAALAPAFDEVVLVGHSFGGLALVSSAIELSQRSPDQVSKMTRLISLAGATGRVRSAEDPILQQWGRHLDTDWVRERVQIGEAAVNLRHLHDAYRWIHEKASVIARHIQLVCVNPWGDSTDSLDELVAPQEALDIIVTLGRGTLVIDKTQRCNLETGQLAHDMGDLKTEMLLKFADASWIPEKQIMQLNHSGLS